MKNITIKKIQLGEEDQIIYLSNGDVIVSSDGNGASYNYNYELYRQFCEYAYTDIDYLKTEEQIKQFKRNSNAYLRYVLEEIEEEGYYTIEEIEKHNFDEFKKSFKALKTIKF